MSSIVTPDPGDPSPTLGDPSDWRWQSKNAIRSLPELERALTLIDAEREGARRALGDGFPMSITPYYLSLADRTDPTCPIRRQCVPVAAEADEVPGDLRDPLGEEANEVAPNLVRRYPDRVLLLATDRCAVYCRFCTRSRMVGDGGGAKSLDALAEAFAYIESNRDLHEVILSGGDPAVMATPRLVALLERLARIEHIGNVRLATRVPVTMPQRITIEFVEALRAAHPSIWVMTHFNHPKEITPESREACRRLVDAGLPVMNQTVLLAGVNDSAETLESLFRGLVRMRVRPYYLLQMDPVRGTSHLRTPLARGMAIVEQLQGRLSGIALPKFICDTPNGRGKVPLFPDPVVGRAPGVTTLRTFRGELVDYVDPPTISDHSSLT